MTGHIGAKRIQELYTFVNTFSHDNTPAMTQAMANAKKELVRLLELNDKYTG